MTGRYRECTVPARMQRMPKHAFGPFDAMATRHDFGVGFPRKFETCQKAGDDEMAVWGPSGGSWCEISGIYTVDLAPVPPAIFGSNSTKICSALV